MPYSQYLEKFQYAKVIEIIPSRLQGRLKLIFPTHCAALRFYYAVNSYFKLPLNSNPLLDRNALGFHKNEKSVSVPKSYLDLEVNFDINYYILYLNEDRSKNILDSFVDVKSGKIVIEYNATQSSELNKEMKEFINFSSEFKDSTSVTHPTMGIKVSNCEVYEKFFNTMIAVERRSRFSFKSNEYLEVYDSDSRGSSPNSSPRVSHYERIDKKYQVQQVNK